MNQIATVTIRCDYVLVTFISMHILTINLQITKMTKEQNIKIQILPIHILFSRIFTYKSL